ncbi:hypothetical protein [Aureimonas glaciei]|uniref:Uncharacterized protein n=1 Tax=Aureimonas glaciei TaxID=1776957 RepID=A0A916Y378_9HYPH|nr:hypothetical protein [Aureimonas glaciei]GGD28842.1 hypothetical protein GCM10011335_34990 [Aureimonas glaciei]
MTYRIDKLLIGSGPNPEHRHVCVASWHDTEAEAVAAYNALEHAELYARVGDGDYAEGAYRFSYEIEEA